MRIFKIIMEIGAFQTGISLRRKQKGFNMDQIRKKDKLHSCKISQVPSVEAKRGY